MLKVLVTVASRHGSTREIGDAVAEVLRSSGFETEVHDPDEVEGLEGYDAVILGSSVYMGRWSPSARVVAERLAMVPHMLIWLFSSGPVGAPLAPAGDPEEVPGLVERLKARGHRTFGGRLDRGDLGMAERAVVALVGAETGDFRSWSEVQRWAGVVASELHAEEIRRLQIVR